MGSAKGRQKTQADIADDQLRFAYLKNDVDGMRLAFSVGASAHAVFKSQMSVLEWAIVSRRGDLAEELLRGERSKRTEQQDEEMVSAGLFTALALGPPNAMELAEAGGARLWSAAELVDLLLRHGANPNARDVFERSPLMACCGLDQWEAAGFLLPAGADIGALDSNELDVFGRAVIQSACKMAALLGSAGATARYGETEWSAVERYASGSGRTAAELRGVVKSLRERSELDRESAAAGCDGSGKPGGMRL